MMVFGLLWPSKVDKPGEEYVRFRGYDYQWRVHAGTTLLRANI